MNPVQALWVGYWTAVGAVIGSFLNVCIYRIPRGESIVFPRSRCPHCVRPIPWYYNIPVVSWLWLRGRCAYCRHPIALRYLVVEVWTAFTFGWLFTQWGWQPTFFILAAFLSVCITLCFIDMEWHLLPDVLTLPGIALGLVVLVPNALVTGWSGLLGLSMGMGIPLVLRGVYWWIAGEEGMGLGDVKFLGMIGVFLGWQRLLWVLLLGSVLGVGLGIVLWSQRRSTSLRRTVIPFGTVLAIAAWVMTLWGDALIRAYEAIGVWLLTAV